jgi:hypothetical protein
MCEGTEMIHQWKEGTKVYWHVHMITNGSDLTDRYVKWQIDWCWANIGSAMSSTITQSYEYTIPEGTPTKTHLIVPIYEWTITGGTIGAHVYPRLTRIASSGTAPTSDPWCTMLQMHVECDGGGSRSYQTK